MAVVRSLTAAFQAGVLLWPFQADDFIAVCGSLHEVQAVAAYVHNYSCKWRFKPNRLKPAVIAC
jgi:hypothetical protein